ncbi:DUF2513 domain-containing protein [Bacillus xiamenensis]|uniref:DUF2513 domain-containing protein n=1 Tax=Bacillus xiamenensis TaxID=1178537 RepID=UPI00028CF724|nr:DUF2513 domain-containing protein [Bacillus xiamenensis]EKF36684.1 hypothetical protein BA1_03840 [Bacillus xiamenensis]MCW1835930.1 DUF2513 domain-containing protein [Bacillus xiamenensis]
MKRDMNLIREILIKLEEHENPNVWLSIEIENEDPVKVSYHIKLLSEARMLEGKDLGIDQYFCWKARSLTYQGHELLDSMRDGTVFKRVKNHFGEKFNSVPLEVIKQMALKFTLESLGIK